MGRVWYIRWFTSFIFYNGYYEMDIVNRFVWGVREGSIKGLRILFKIIKFLNDEI